VFVSLFLARSSFAAPDAVDVARIHWLGLKQVSADTNAAQFMKVWQLPQTAALVSQTLGKLSRWPGHGVTNAASAALRPLLDDLIASEFYLEISAPTNHQPSTINYQLSLAVRLPADRARLWQTNLAAGSAAWAAAGTPHRIECSRSGDWTLVGVDLDKPVAKTVFAARLSLPSLSTTNDWLEADFNNPCLAAVFSTINNQLPTINHLHLTLSGDSGNVHTLGGFDFSQPLETPLPAWEIPTNLIHGPLTSFTAVRGFAPWLAGLPAWQKLSLTPAPDQAYFWAQATVPFQTHFAAPLPEASNQIWQLSTRLTQNANPWLATNASDAGSFQWQANPPELVWKNLFIISPFLKSVRVYQHDYVLGGLVPLTEGDASVPLDEIFKAVLVAPNLAYYQTEHTGLRIDEYLYITQLFRVAFDKPQLPEKAPATVWLKNIEPLLGYSVTSVTQTGMQQYTLARNSTIGFTALELHLLADWLESPQFPRGFHTLLAPPDKNF